MGTLITDGGGRAGRAVDRRPRSAAGARLLTGGERDGAVIAPAVVADVDPASPFSQDELFGPAVAVSTADGLAVARSRRPTAPPTGSAPGSSPPTSRARSGRSGRSTPATIHINWTPLWRADLMPYGGLKGSGIGKEGPRSAVAEMTDVKTVILHGRPW